MPRKYKRKEGVRARVCSWTAGCKTKGLPVKKTKRDRQDNVKDTNKYNCIECFENYKKNEVAIRLDSMGNVSELAT